VFIKLSLVLIELSELGIAPRLVPEILAGKMLQDIADDAARTGAGSPPENILRVFDPGSIFKQFKKNSFITGLGLRAALIGKMSRVLQWAAAQIILYPNIGPGGQKNLDHL
jgi:hypothetical protein